MRAGWEAGAPKQVYYKEGEALCFALLALWREFGYRNEVGEWLSG